MSLVIAALLFLPVALMAQDSPTVKMGMTRPQVTALLGPERGEIKVPGGVTTVSYDRGDVSFAKGKVMDIDLLPDNLTNQEVTQASKRAWHADVEAGRVQNQTRLNNFVNNGFYQKLSDRNKLKALRDFQNANPQSTTLHLEEEILERLGSIDSDLKKPLQTEILNTSTTPNTNWVKPANTSQGGIQGGQGNQNTIDSANEKGPAGAVGEPR
ncbi:MAG: hypothetical protein SFY92_03235 [Verrucomicrobiae bacterium]|nr:hypothetical protein [Verrucomicrobiae bacterium]